MKIEYIVVTFIKKGNFEIGEKKKFFLKELSMDDVTN